MDLYYDPGEVSRLGKFFVQAALPYPLDKAVGILHRQRQAHKVMGLKLRGVDDFIKTPRPPGKRHIILYGGRPVIIEEIKELAVLIEAQILVDLGVREIRLLTNNPKKIVGLEGYGLRIVERIPIEVTARQENIRYLRTKKEKLGHLLGKL